MNRLAFRTSFAAAAPLLLAAAVALPLLIVLASFLAPSDEAIAHVWATTGPRYLMNTIALACLVALGAGVVGVGAAAAVSMMEFPGRSALSIALAAPLAVPAYIAAYAWGDLFGPFGAATALFGGGLEVKSLGGAAFILTLANYPYVYLAARASFESRSGAFLEAARTLGASPWRFFRCVLAPAGRPAIFGGLALALMETVADYGVADYLGVPTLSVGVFRTWRGLGDLNAASQLAGGLLIVALVLVLIEEVSRRGLFADGVRGRAPMRLRMGRLQSMGALVLCASPFLLGFLAPTLTLLAKVFEGEAAWRGLWSATRASASVALVGAVIAVACAAVLALASRNAKGPFRRPMIRVATLGYALPGAVVAVSIVAAAALLNVGLAAGLIALLYAYVVRFSTAAFNAIDGGLKQIHPATEDAARSLGASLPRIASAVFLPATRSALVAGALIVFIDICRELPATLLLRPFNFQTLATEVYRLASDERLAEAAPAALALIALSLAPTFLVNALGRVRR